MKCGVWVSYETHLSGNPGENTASRTNKGGLCVCVCVCKWASHNEAVSPNLSGKWKDLATSLTPGSSFLAASSPTTPGPAAQLLPQPSTGKEPPIPEPFDRPPLVMTVSFDPAIPQQVLPTSLWPPFWSSLLHSSHWAPNSLPLIAGTESHGKQPRRHCC